MSHPTREVVGLDELTGVWNRPGFVTAGTPLFVSCQRRATPTALAYFDFHAADVTARAVSDAVTRRSLVAMADLLGKAFRTSDVIGRVAPLRFAVLLGDCTDEALAAVEGVRAVTGGTRSPDGLALSVGMVRSGTASTLEALMREGDERIYEIKRESTLV